MIHKRDAKEWAQETLKGLWTSPMIPFASDFSLDEAGIRRNVERLIDLRVDGIGMGFSEPWVCSIAERKRIMEVSIDAVRGRVPAYLHATDHSVIETVNLIKHAEAVGADAVMVWTPYEWAKSQQMVIDYYEYVASRVDIAIFAYNTPHSGICMTPETVSRLAEIPNVCGVKNAFNDIRHTVRCMELCGNRAVVSLPTEEAVLTLALQFGQQVMLGTTAVFLMQSPHYQPIRDYFRLALEGKAAEASRIFYELQPLRDVWNGIYQVLRNHKAALHPIPFLKYWMDLIGMAGGPVRPPMHQAPEEEKARFKARLEGSGWMEKLFPKKAAAE